MFLRVLATIALATAATAAAEPSEAPRPATVDVPRIDRPPRLEEFVGMEPSAELAGRMAKVEGPFLQRIPVDDAPSTERTDVYLAYDAANLYAAFVAFDDEPGKIRANLSRRENIFGDDIVQIMVDTFRDRRRAYSFICNPFGVQFDAIWTEGQDFDASFDTVWASEGRVTDRGYVVLMTIPFKSLRFPLASEQTWGLLFNRDIPRKNEETFWPRYSQKIDGRLNQMGTLTGLRDISPGRNLLFIPYGAARWFRTDEADGAGAAVAGPDHTEGRAGLDTKAVFNDGIVLDATINPDFSQVESDEPQVTVNQRFEVFFPEKRPFFLENAGYFQTPIDLVFTRRIADPRLGARVTGKAGPWALGALLVDDRGPGEIAAPGTPERGERASYGVVRVNRDVAAQSTVGALVSDRELAGGFNRVGSVDARVKWSERWTSLFQAATSRTRTPDAIETEGNAYYAQADRAGESLKATFRYQDVSPGFVAENGYVPRRDFREVYEDVRYVLRPGRGDLISYTPELSGLYNRDYTGLRLDARLRPEIGFEWAGQTYLFVAGTFGRTRLRPADFPALSVDRDYAVLADEVEFETQRWKRLSLTGSASIGHDVNYVPPAGTAPYPADTFYASAGATMLPSPRVRVDVALLFTRLTEQGSGDPMFTNSIARLRAGLQFTRRASLRLIVRFDRTDADPSKTSLTTARNLNGDVLFTYQVNPWTAVYAGYNSNLARPPFLNGAPAAGPDGYVEDARQAFVKVSYLVRW